MSDKKMTNSATAGLAGLAIGALAGAAAMALSDKDTRKKVMDKADDVTRKAQDAYKGAADKMSSGVESVRGKFNKSTNQIGEAMETVEENVTITGEKGGKKSAQVKSDIKDIVE
jgi:gas vesicle protein